jgi:hypothetical protein
MNVNNLNTSSNTSNLRTRDIMGTVKALLLSDKCKVSTSPILEAPNEQTSVPPRLIIFNLRIDPTRYSSLHTRYSLEQSTMGMKTRTSWSMGRRWARGLPCPLNHPIILLWPDPWNLGYNSCESVFPSRTRSPQVGYERLMRFWERTGVPRS